MASSGVVGLALALFAYTPALRPLALHEARCAPAVLQFDIGKQIGKQASKMGQQLTGNVMEKMGLGNPADMGLSDDDAKEMEERLRGGTMTFDDFMMQVKVMDKAASMQAMLGKLGGGQVSKEQLDEGKKKMQRYTKYVEAMDAEERTNAQLIIDEAAIARKGGDAPRLTRIAEASGATIEQVGQFVMEFNVMRGAAVKFANGESPESIRQSMMEEQQQGGKPMNRQQRRLAAKKGKKKARPAAGGFGR